MNKTSRTVTFNSRVIKVRRPIRYSVILSMTGKILWDFGIRYNSNFINEKRFFKSKIDVFVFSSIKINYFICRVIYRDEFYGFQ